MGVSYLHGQEGETFPAKKEHWKGFLGIIYPHHNGVFGRACRIAFEGYLRFLGAFFSLAKKGIELGGKWDPTPFTTITDNLRCTHSPQGTSFLFSNPFLYLIFIAATVLRAIFRCDQPISESTCESPPPKTNPRVQNTKKECNSKEFLLGRREAEGRESTQAQNSVFSDSSKAS